MPSAIIYKSINSYTSKRCISGIKIFIIIIVSILKIVKGFIAQILFLTCTKLIRVICTFITNIVVVALFVFKTMIKFRSLGTIRIYIAGLWTEVQFIIALGLICSKSWWIVCAISIYKTYMTKKSSIYG